MANCTNEGVLPLQITTEFMQYIPVCHWYCNNKHHHEK